ncbi:hypothetical protein niasHT_001923 [Heterodera trifolii]|uniref:Uncharacterized protein n=1 Tax=Heterodera trifolii TaxID=157864 RepID=A0ABD2LV50_9BILA
MESDRIMEISEISAVVLDGGIAAHSLTHITTSPSSSHPPPSLDLGEVALCFEEKEPPGGRGAVMVVPISTTKDTTTTLKAFVPFPSKPGVSHAHSAHLPSFILPLCASLFTEIGTRRRGRRFPPPPQPRLHPPIQVECDENEGTKMEGYAMHI